MIILRRYLKVCLVFMLIAATCLLTGCLKNDVLDEQMHAFVSAYNRKDAKQIVSQFYKSGISEEEIEKVILQAHDLVGTLDESALRLTSINIRSQSVDGSRFKIYEGTYQFKKDGSAFTLDLIYATSADAGSGLIRFHFTPIAETSYHLSTVSIIYLATVIIHAIGIIVSFIDIIRKKRKKKILLFILVLVYLRLNVSPYAIMLPLGSIIYWCIRNNLAIKQKPAENTDIETPSSLPIEESNQDETAEPALNDTQDEN